MAQQPPNVVVAQTFSPSFPLSLRCAFAAFSGFVVAHAISAAYLARRTSVFRAAISCLFTPFIVPACVPAPGWRSCSSRFALRAGRSRFHGQQAVVYGSASRARKLCLRYSVSRFVLSASAALFSFFHPRLTSVNQPGRFSAAGYFALEPLVGIIARSWCRR